MLRPASQAGPMHETAGEGKLVNAVLLSLINEACVGDKAHLHGQSLTKFHSSRQAEKLPAHARRQAAKY